MNEGCTAALAHWAATVERARILSASEEIIAAIRDVLGCILAGQAEPEPQRVARAVAGWGEGPVHIIGTKGTAVEPFAALINGAAAHILDYDDFFAPLSGHACATIVPAVLAMAERRDASGADVIDAVGVALEICARIGVAVNPRHYAIGWHSTSTIGVIAAAVGCARILSLSPEQMRNAISLAVSQSAGSRMQLGTQAKCIHAGLAAQGGVLAASLAAHGLAGADEALVGRWRFAELYAGVAPAITPPSADEKLAIVSPGMTYKPYPTCGSTHRSIAAILSLRATHGIRADEVAGIEVVVPAVNRRNLTYPDPRTGMQARFSMEYCAAVACIHGAVGLADFTIEAIGRADVQALMRRVDMRELPGSEDGAKDYLEYPAHTRIRMHDGRSFEDTRYHRPGSPMTLAEQRAKFRDCAAVALQPARIDVSDTMLVNLVSIAHISELIGALQPSTPAPDRLPAA